MAENIPEEKIRKVIAQVKHSAIDSTLVDLGIVKEVTVKGNNVSVTLAFPFANIPIKDYLIMSVRVPLERLGVKVKVKTTVMNQEETERFLAMEEKHWKGST